MELDILLRGQSNAFLLADDTKQAIAQEVQQLLGFDGSNNKVVLLAAWDTPGAQSIVASSAFIDDWMWRDAGGQWQPQANEQDLLNFAAQHHGATETAVLWLHNEYDSTNPAITTADWASAVRADAALLRQALGQDAAHAPYMFVSAIPFESAYDTSTQAIRAGMEQLAADPNFHAAIAARALDLDMSYRFPSEGPNYHTYGGDHMSAGDATLIAGRAAHAIAQEWADYAQPGSPVALAGGNIADLGPEVVAATLTASDTLTLTLTPDAAGGLHATGRCCRIRHRLVGARWRHRNRRQPGQYHRRRDAAASLPQRSACGRAAILWIWLWAAAGWDQPGYNNALYDSAGLAGLDSGGGSGAWRRAAYASPGPGPGGAGLVCHRRGDDRLQQRHRCVVER